MINTSSKFEDFYDPYTLHLAHEVLSDEQIKALYKTAPFEAAKRIIRSDPNHDKQYRMNLFYLLEKGKKNPETQHLSPEWRHLLDSLLSKEFSQWLEAGTQLKLRDLVLDIGMYTHVNGDFITVHRDKPSKALTAILYLNDYWPDNGGGEYEIRYSADPAAQPARCIPARGGKLLAFPPTEKSWHAVSPVHTSEKLARLTVQLEYWKVR